MIYTETELLSKRQIYTEEQWKLIKQASPHYETARREYIRNAPRWLTEQIMNVYEAATGKTVMHKDLSCAVCVLNIYKQIGKTYFADLENHQNNIAYLEDKNKLELKDAEQPKNNTIGNAKPNRRNKKTNKRSS